MCVEKTPAGRSLPRRALQFTGNVYRPSLGLPVKKHKHTTEFQSVQLSSGSTDTGDSSRSGVRRTKQRETVITVATITLYLGCFYVGFFCRILSRSFSMCDSKKDQNLTRVAQSGAI